MKMIVITISPETHSPVLVASEVTDKSYRLVLESSGRELLELPWTDTPITEDDARTVAKMLGYSNFQIFEEQMVIKKYRV